MMDSPSKQEHAPDDATQAQTVPLSLQLPAAPSTPLARSVDPMAEITTGFTGLALQAENYENMKRSADRMTVEGSPCNHYVRRDSDLESSSSSPQAKRVDNTKTPYALSLDSATSTASASPQWKECARTLSLPLSERDSSQPVLIISSGSDDHETGAHQENARRTALLVGPEGCLRRPQLQSGLLWISHGENATDKQANSPPPAPFTDLLRVHEFTYLQHMRDKCQAAARKEKEQHEGATFSSSSKAASDPVRNNVTLPLPPFYAPVGQLDTDTPLAPKSLEAATRFCGSAMWAVDYLLDPGTSTTTSSSSSSSSSSNNKDDKSSSGAKANRVFVIGRPPGHHAGPFGCVPSPTFFRVPGMTSSGFCLLNTVAVAAAYARYKYGRLSLLREHGASDAGGQYNGPKPRIAIIDIDIHHGNGTEAIVRNLSPSMVPLPLPSSWAPQYTPSYKPWLDESDQEETFFGSIHLYGGDLFYPCSGADEISVASSSSSSSNSSNSSNVVNIGLTPLGPGPWDARARAKLTPAQLKALTDAASVELREKVTRMLLPSLHDFRPTLVFISAGFDAHFDDLYHFLSERDFHWMTEQLCRIADMHSAKVISVLEGGYSLSGTYPKEAPRVRGTRKGPASDPRSDSDVDPAVAFAQQAGDGGLVKGVLAHTAALAGRASWM